MPELARRALWMLASPLARPGPRCSKVAVGNPHTSAKNVQRLLDEGYKFLMAAPQRSYGVVGQGREMAGY